MPKIEIKSISISIDGKNIDFPKGFYNDLFEPNLAGLDFYVISDHIWILLLPSNSDGAGAYDAAFIIKDGRPRWRTILQL